MNSLSNFSKSSHPTRGFCCAAVVLRLVMEGWLVQDSPEPMCYIHDQVTSPKHVRLNFQKILYSFVLGLFYVNSVDPDEMPPYAAAFHLDLHCL